MQQNNKEPKRGTLDSFFRSASFKKKKMNASNSISMIDESSPVVEPDATISSSADNRSKSQSPSVPSPTAPTLSISSSTTLSLPSPSAVSSSPKSQSSSILSLSSCALAPLSSLSCHCSSLCSTLAPSSSSPLGPPSSPSRFFSINPTSPPSRSSSINPTSPPSRSSSKDPTSPPSQPSPLVSLSSPSQSSCMVIVESETIDIADSRSDISRSSKEQPTQPNLSSYKTNKDNRSFRSVWYATFPWLEYSVSKDAVFCYYCRHFSDGYNLLNRNQSDAFISGYSNWKNAMTKKQGFLKHEASATHKYAFVNYQQCLTREKSHTTVVNVIDKSRAESIRRNRQRLTKIASALLLCSRQSISLRGHIENVSSNNRGNFIEILKWASKSDPSVNSIFADSAENATYLSPLIQNELIHLMANQIRFKIAGKIHGHVFALMADEARDSSGHEQLSIVLRFISDEPIKQNDKTNFHLIFKEHLIGLVRLREFDAQSLTNEIIQYLSYLKIDASNCIALCFDGAAVMSGKHAGVQAILREKYMFTAIYVHCFAHKLNLVICDVSKVVPYLSEFYSVVSRIYTYYHSSSVTNESFQQVQQRLMIENNRPICLKKWCETRWDSRWSSINAVIENYQVLTMSLEELIDEGDERSIDARALSSALKVPMFVVTLFILHKLFGIIKVLSDQLKAKTIDFYYAQCLVKSVIDQIGDLRSESEFSNIYSKIKQFSEEQHIDLASAPRQRRKTTVSSRFKNAFITCSIGQRDDLNTEDKFRTDIFYPVIDSILIELNDRFSSQNMEILNSISALCPNHKSFLDIDVLKAFSSHMKVDSTALFNEVHVLRAMLKDTKLESIVDLYLEILPLKQAFPTILSLIIAAMTTPVSSTTCERTFSKMKIIKTAARNTMSDTRLSDLCVLTVERDFDINLEQVIDDFADHHQNSRVLLK